MVKHHSEPIGKEKKLVVFSDLKLRKTGRLPPPSNTGGLGTLFSLRPDYLTLSIPALQVRFKVEKIILKLFGWFCRHFEHGVKLEKRSGRHFFEHGYFISDSGGKELLSFHYGGNGGRLFVEIKGGGCKLLDAWQWSRIYSLAVRYKARINRYDLAGDDWAGDIFILKKIRAAHKKDERSFLAESSRGNKPPPMSIHATYKGYTLEFGTDSTSYFHVVYQKFRESGDTYLGRTNPRWMRWEVRFYRQSNMEIDISIIHPDNWQDAYLGSCGYLRRLLGHEGRRFVHRVEHIKESPLDAAAKRYIRIGDQYGGTFSEWQRMGLEVPLRPYSDGNSPYAALTIDDKPEILKRIDLARRGVLRSIAPAFVDLEADILF